MPIFVLLILFFALELALFIEWGSQLGVLVTLLEIFLSAVLGVQVIRLTGFRLLRDLQANMHNQWWLQVRKQTLMRRIVAALLLIIPGFATDLVGVALLIWSLFGSRPATQHRHQEPPRDPAEKPSGRVIEGEYEEASRPDASDQDHHHKS